MYQPKVALLSICFALFYLNTFAQISGEVQSNINFYQRDSAVQASGNPLYNNFLSGGENWLALRYNGSKGFTANVRVDGFYNSNLLDPYNAYSDAGIGMFNLSKEWDNLTITVGHIYDQIGSGILYRSYEDRPLLIDNATFGVQGKYNINNKYYLKAFAGQTRNLFERYKPIIKGINLESEYDLKGIHLTPGIGVLNRTYDDATIASVVSEVNTLPVANRFVPLYNNYAATFYNTLNYKNLTWYAEYAIKSDEFFKDLGDRLVNKSGQVIYSTIGYAINKLGINLSGKYTQNFIMRVQPYTAYPIRNFSNWQPVIATIRPQRTIARYTPQSIDVSELSSAINIFYNPNDKTSLNATLTQIDDLNNNKLYREVYIDAENREIKDIILHVGYQYLLYNQAVYQGKPLGSMFTAHTIFAEATYKVNKKQSAKLDLQYMHAVGDFGGWVYALIEYNIAPSWAFAIGDMFNTTYGANLSIHPGLKPQHYPNFFAAYTKNAHRFTAQYVKQVAGINCTGGVCRFEPAFSGFKFGVISSF
jgi:hypothetical protein